MAIYEKSNLGQSAACLDGYRASHGHYVVFVDADDYYFDTFAETHIVVHLSLRHAPGFTSSDMTQVADGALVLGTLLQAYGPFQNWMFNEVELNTPRFFAKAHNDGFQFAVDVKDIPLRAVSLTADSWVWAPTSGTMYRRDALEVFVNAAGLPTLRYSTDAFFNYAINPFTGSVLIEKPLAEYRIHGSNVFARHPSLRNIQSSNEKADLAPEAAKLALAHIIANLDMFSDKAMTPRQLSRAMGALSRKAGSKRWRGTDKLYTAFLRLYWRTKFRLP